jgi:hypothetical protein
VSADKNVIAFYAQQHWGSRYGVIDQFHPTKHKGLDVGLFRGLVQVPALLPGTVVAIEPSQSVGHYVTVQRADKKFNTYCHIVPSIALGARVAQGANLGRQAITQEEGGNAWRGQHTHLTLSDTLTGWTTWGPNNLDPTPDVLAVLASTASSGGVPINQEEDMSFAIVPLADGAKDIEIVSLISGLRTHIQSPYHVTLLQRLKANNGDDGMLEGEVNICKTYLAAVNPQVAAAPAPPVDVSALAAKLVPLLVPLIPVPPTDFTITGKASA